VDLKRDRPAAGDLIMKTNMLHAVAIGFTAAMAGGASMAASPACMASTGATAPTVVELYTSEGCSSCPPADRWFSTLKDRGDVLTMAFHVNYWDRLGWVDRYATPAATARQYELAHWMGSSNVYTPQVVVNGRDASPGVRLPHASGASRVAVTLLREGDLVTAQVAASKTGPSRLDGYWAVVEDGHQSKVRAGENSGETLKHDSVVRLYQPVAAWASAEGNRAQLNISRGVENTPRRVVFVVTDAVTHRPLQAVALGC
jgi:hypothetical protein